MTLPANIQTGINTIISMIPLLSDPKFEATIAEEQDLVLELTSLKQTVLDFASTTDNFETLHTRVKDQMLKSTSREESARLLAFSGPMFYMVIEPLINTWSEYNTGELETHATAMIDEAIVAATNSTSYGTVERAQQIRFNVMQTIRQKPSEESLQLTVAERALAVLIALDAD